MWHRCFWWIQKCWKTDNFDFWQFLNWGAKFVILNWPLWDKNWSLTWVCVLSILAPAGALLFSISQHFTSNISPNTSNIFWKYFALELYFWSSESGTRLSFVKSESGSEYGAVTQAVRRLLHNSKRVLMMMMMMIIIHPFDHHHVVSPSLSFDEDDDDCGSFFYFTFYPYVDGDDDDDDTLSGAPRCLRPKKLAFLNQVEWTVHGGSLNKMIMDDHRWRWW